MKQRFESFLAARLCRSGDTGQGGTRPAVVISTAGIAVGIVVMIATIAITRGFSHQIREKVSGFTQDIRVTNSRSDSNGSVYPLSCTAELMAGLEANGSIHHVQRFAEKAGMIRTDSAFQGFILKGVGQEYDMSMYERYLQSGCVPQVSDSVASGKMMLSGTLARKLGLEVGDKIDIYFIGDAVKARRLELAGIFQTNFSEYDQLYGMTDLYTLQKLQGWSGGQAQGLEVSVAEPDLLFDATLAVRSAMDEAEQTTGEQAIVLTTEQLNAGLYAWLDVLSVNVWVILVLMLGIAGFTMISGLLIIIFERTRTIGLLKALGACNVSIRKVFLYIAARIIGRGMLIGNAAGIGLCLLQQKTGLIPLDPANYYLDSVPMELGLGWLVVMNVAVFALSLLMLLGPSAVIARIYPSESMRFE